MKGENGELQTTLFSPPPPPPPSACPVQLSIPPLSLLCFPAFLSRGPSWFYHPCILSTTVRRRGLLFQRRIGDKGINRVVSPHPKLPCSLEARGFSLKCRQLNWNVKNTRDKLKYPGFRQSVLAQCPIRELISLICALNVLCVPIWCKEETVHRMLAYRYLHTVAM